MAGSPVVLKGTCRLAYRGPELAAVKHSGVALAGGRGWLWGMLLIPAFLLTVRLWWIKKRNICS